MSFAPSHFLAVLLFATFTSTVFGITQRITPRAMVRYGLYCWVLFVGVGDCGELADVLRPAIRARPPTREAVTSRHVYRAYGAVFCLEGDPLQPKMAHPRTGSCSYAGHTTASNACRSTKPIRR